MTRNENHPNISTEPLNHRKREMELDIAKGFAIIFMVWCHTIEELIDESDFGIFDSIVDEILGGPFAAPVFMFAMGVGVVYSRHNDAHALLRRGFRLLLLGWGLNVVRFGIPWLIAVLAGNHTLWDARYGLFLLEVDILAFAGLSFLVLGIIKKIGLGIRTVFITAGIMALVGTFFRNVSISNPVLSQLAAYFVGTTNEETCFPLFNWFLFIACGIGFGKILRHTENKNKLYRFDWLCLIVSTVYCICSYEFNFGIFGDTAGYYYMSILDGVVITLFVYGIIGIYYRISKVLPRSIEAYMEQLSRNINAIYCIHWVILELSSTIIFLIFPNMNFNFIAATSYAFVLLIFSIWLAKKGVMPFKP